MMNLFFKAKKKSFFLSQDYPHLYSNAVKKMKYGSTLAIGVFILFSSCRKDPPVSTPPCIQASINRIAPTAPAGTTVKEYLFQNKPVWVFNQLQEFVDGSAPVLNKNCDTLGGLGGYGNSNQINGEDFSHAIYIRTVYSK